MEQILFALDKHPLVLPKERYQIMTHYFESAPHIRSIDIDMAQCDCLPKFRYFVKIGKMQYLDFSVSSYHAKTFRKFSLLKGNKSLFYSERQEIWNQNGSHRFRFSKRICLLLIIR